MSGISTTNWRYDQHESFKKFCHDAVTCRSHNSLDLIHVQKLWAQATVHAKNLLVDNGGDREAVEAISERLP